MAADLDYLFIKSLNNAKIPGTYIRMIELTEAIPINVGGSGYIFLNLATIFIPVVR